MKEYPKPEMLETDSDAMTEAFAWLEAERVPFRRPSRYHLKVAHINFYPDRGTIHIDGATKTNQKSGFEEFQRLIHEYQISKLARLRIDIPTIDAPRHKR